jgi:hypothetical protein
MLAVATLMIACCGSRAPEPAPFDPVGVWEAVPGESAWRSEGGPWRPVDAAYVEGDAVSFLRDGSVHFTIADSMRGADEVVPGWEHVIENKTLNRWRVIASRIEVRRGEEVTHTFDVLGTPVRLVSSTAIPGYEIKKVWRRRD